MIQPSQWVGIYSKKMKILIQKDLCTLHVDCSIIYNSQDKETTYVSVSGEIDKENIVHIHSGILFGHKKKEILPFVTT